MIAAYCWPQSVLPGDAVDLFASASAGPITIEIVRQGVADEQVWRREDVPAQEQPVPADVGTQGCGWQATLSLPVEASWRTGFYLVRLTAADGETAEAFFVVRATTPRAAKRRESSSVIATDRWRPPVQPIAMVR